MATVMTMPMRACTAVATAMVLERTRVAETSQNMAYATGPTLSFVRPLPSNFGQREQGRNTGNEDLRPVKCKVPDEEQRGLRPHGAFRGHNVQDADEEHDDGEDGKPSVVQDAATELLHEEPAEDRGDPTHGHEADAHVVRLRRVETSKAEKLCFVVEQVDSAENLRSIYPNRDFGTAPVHLPEHVGVGGSSFHLPL